MSELKRVREIVRVVALKRWIEWLLSWEWELWHSEVKGSDLLPGGDDDLLTCHVISACSTFMRVLCCFSSPSSRVRAQRPFSTGRG